MLSAGSKVIQLDCNLAALGHLALSHQNISGPYDSCPYATQAGSAWNSVCL